MERISDPLPFTVCIYIQDLYQELFFFSFHYYLETFSCYHSLMFKIVDTVKQLIDACINSLESLLVSIMSHYLKYFIIRILDSTFWISSYLLFEMLENISS